jgi:hypothetical protein
LAVPLELVCMELLVGVFCTVLPRHTLYLLWDTVRSSYLAHMGHLRCSMRWAAHHRGSCSY